MKNNTNLNSTNASYVFTASLDEWLNIFGETWGVNFFILFINTPIALLGFFLNLLNIWIFKN